MDILRASAILVVIFDHSWYFTQESKYLKNPFSACGFIGVELFFVLSGFLIGQIVINKLSANINFKNLLNFYSRRWFRTLPVYYLMLITLIVGSNFIYHTSNFHPEYFFFIQNFFPQQLDFFGVAWSLSIEEWFYFLLPLLFLLVPKKREVKTLKFLLVTVAAIFLIKVLITLNQNLSFEQIRKNIPLRFDSLLIGVLLAAIKIEKNNLYTSLQSLKFFLISLAGIILIGAYYTLCYLSGTLDQSLMLRLFGFVLISFSTAGMIPYLEKSPLINIKAAANRRLFSFVTLTSAISYSLYLVHLQVFTVFIKIFNTRLPAPINFMTATSVAFIAAFVLYSFIEKPAMFLRDRLTLSRKL